ncbi:MAG: hypothetical protein IKB23_02890 [Clostridia bacterium]|nr:hypothetical protein [Clostridia bacterium]
MPIISAVGHETDFTICDFVSDMRAPTPSAAAELAVPDYKELSVRVDSAYGRIVNSLKRSAERCEERLNFISGKDIFKDSEALLRSKTEQLQKISTECEDICTDILEKKSTELALVASKAHALSPLATLCRGYAFISSGSDIPVKSVEDVSSGDEISVAFSDGRVTARVMDKKEKLKRGRNDE